MIISSEKFQRFINSAGANINSPEQRLILGVTALGTQPVIDLYNKNVDEDTRTLAACKSVAKIIAGTTSGYFVRALCTSCFTKLTQEGKLLDPEKFIKGTTKELSNAFGKNLGTMAAIFVMLGTNFLWDAPVTKKLTNFFYSKVKKEGNKNVQ